MSHRAKTKDEQLGSTSPHSSCLIHNANCLAAHRVDVSTNNNQREQGKPNEKWKQGRKCKAEPKRISALILDKGQGQWHRVSPSNTHCRVNKTTKKEEENNTAANAPFLLLNLEGGMTRRRRQDEQQR